MGPDAEIHHPIQGHPAVGLVPVDIRNRVQWFLKKYKPCMPMHLMSSLQPCCVKSCGSMQALVLAVADEIQRAGKTDRVILGSLGSPAIWRMCGEALPDAQRILPMREVRARGGDPACPEIQTLAGLKGHPG